MSNWYVLDDNLEPVLEPDLLTAARWFEVAENRQVAYTEINADHYLSTVFLGLDHNYRGGKPILYESMWFGGPENPDGGGDSRRYHTREEAIEGHKEMLRERGYATQVNIESLIDMRSPWKIDVIGFLKDGFFDMED